MKMRVLELLMPRGPVIRIRSPDHLIIPKLIEAGGGLKGYEGHTFACALACLSSKPGTFYDVGANVGVFSLLVASTLQVKTHAFEPTPEIADVLARTAQVHDLPIELHRYALSDKAGTAKFYLSTRSDASNSLQQNFRPGSPNIVVEMKKLDDVINPLDPPSLIKIDVETAEPQVLAGSSKTIETARPFIIVEILNSRIGEKVNKFFKGRKYSCYHITSKGVWRRHRHVPVEFDAKERNWLFAPDALDANFLLNLDAWRWRIFHS